MTVDSEVICKLLQSLDRRERQRALNDLLEFAMSPNVKQEDVVKVYDGTYLYIWKCYSDKYESCRELATSVVNEFLRHLPKNDYYLQYVISTLASRIGQKETTEESEEIRLLLLNQLDFVIDKFRAEKPGKEGDFLLKCYDEIINILLKELRDDYPSAQRAACACIRTLAGATPSFHYRAEALVQPLIPILHHKHSMNRINAVETLGVVALHILTNSECITQIITEISPLLMDSMPLVRKECGKVGCRFLMELRDRYSFFARILPLVLCCLNDDTPDVRDYTYTKWVKCGEQYYEENETELSKKEIVDEPPSHYPADIKRPNIGCRAIVQRSLQMIQLVLRETSDWKEEVRLHSLKLLWQIILHAEAMIAVHVLDMFPVIARTCADPDKFVAREALKCAELMGILMIYKEWFESCLSLLEKHPRLGYVKCFHSMFSAAVFSSSREDAEKLSKILHHRDFSHSLNPEFQMYLLKFVDVLIERKNQQQSILDAMENLSVSDINDKTEEFLYHIIIKVISLSYDSDDETLRKYGSEMLLKLANNDENAMMKLHAKHLNSVLATFDCLDAENDENSEPILLLHGVICTCGFQCSYLDNIRQLILTVWEHGSNDGKVKILSAISIAMMSWSQTISTDAEQSFDLLKKFVGDIIQPHLVWRAGASAEGLRTLATATLCSIAQGAPNEAPTLLSSLSEILISLVEDHSATTRVYALRTLMNIGPVPLEHFRTLGFAVVQRLDDPSAEARDWAARAIAKIRVDDKCPSSDDSVKYYMANVFSTLFLHFEGPELKLRNTIKESLISLGKVHTEVFRDAFDKAYLCAGPIIKEELNGIKQLVFP